jgi:signal transduction histidine kinase
MGETKLTISGPTGTNEVPLKPKGTTIGRGANCDVMLDHYAVSRLHARIYRDPFGRWIIEDLDSQNGVLIGGQHIKAQAVVPGEEIIIRPFTLSLVQQSDEQTATGASIRDTMAIVDKGLEEDIVSYRADRASTLSPVLIQDLNELRNRLLKLSSPSDLYAEACVRLAKTLGALVAVVRLPCGSDPLPKSPDILACNFGAAESETAVADASRLHLSKRVLEAVRSADTPVMASSGLSGEQRLKLTVVDKHRPHVVFSARVNEVGERIDALYLDMPEERSPREMFDFVEAAASQINFVQKTLFLAELRKQEKALREANTQLREKDRIKDEYVSRVTHDIKGHLAAVQSCLSVVAASPSDSFTEKQSDFLGRAVRRTAQLTTFVKELLNLTQMRLSGRLQMAPFSLADSISKALASVTRNAEDKSITVTSDVAPSIGQIVGNEFSINEVLTNLLLNAIKYTPDGGTVRLKASSLDERVQIDISDTGIGIPAKEISSIVKQIVERHGGSITVKSEEGRGTTLTVTLPVNNPASG